ncbi:MAG TPA: transcriptional regulator [Nitrospiraceae bacterium]|jgi:putative transcriptional regulator|nr:transcriptional regulator [Nitrospiraceae bacterium]
MSKKKYKSDVLRSVHEGASDLHKIGLIDEKTMREFDASCLTTIRDLSPKQITQLRKRAGVSQAVFAQYLNVSVSALSKWEQGQKKPSGTALKLLTVVQKKGLEAIA